MDGTPLAGAPVEAVDGMDSDFAGSRGVVGSGAGDTLAGIRVLTGALAAAGAAAGVVVFAGVVTGVGGVAVAAGATGFGAASGAAVTGAGDV